MQRRLAHAGHVFHGGPRRRVHFAVPRAIVFAVATLHRWRRQVLRVWSPVDALPGAVFFSLMAGSCWAWWRVGKLFVGALAS